jgi:hypothetical protein
MVRWRVSQNDLDRLSVALKPIRARREVAEILGCSTSLVCQLESSGLRKIVRAMNGFEKNGKGRP